MPTSISPLAPSVFPSLGRIPAATSNSLTRTASTSAISTSSPDLAAVVANEVEDIDLSIRVDIKPGKLQIPADFGTADIRIEPGTYAEIEFHVDRVGDKPTISMAELRFVDADGKPLPITVTNPADALEPGTGLWHDMVSWFKDAFADAKLSKVYLDPNGRVKLGGTVETVGSIKSWPLMSFVNSDGFPQIDMDLADIAAGNAIVDPGDKPAGSASVDLQAVMARVGAKLGQAVYNLSIDTRPVTFVSRGEDTDLMAGFEHLHAEARGRASFYTSPGTGLVLDRIGTNGGISLRAPFGGVSGGTSSSARAETVSIDFDGTLERTRSANNPTLEGRARISANAVNTAARSGNISVSIDGDMPFGATLDTLSINPESRRFAAAGQGDIPPGLPGIFEELAFELTEAGGSVTLRGSRANEELTYRRTFGLIA